MTGLGPHARVTHTHLIEQDSDTRLAVRRGFSMPEPWSRCPADRGGQQHAARSSARLAARLTAVVVLPTPPFCWNRENSVMFPPGGWRRFARPSIPLADSVPGWLTPPPFLIDNWPGCRFHSHAQKNQMRLASSPGTPQRMVSAPLSRRQAAMRSLRVDTALKCKAHASHGKAGGAQMLTPRPFIDSLGAERAGRAWGAGIQAGR